MPHQNTRSFASIDNIICRYMETKNTKNVSIVSITPKTNTGIATRLQPGTGGFAIAYTVPRETDFACA